MPLNPRTPVSVSVAGWASICVTVGIFGWQANNYFRDIRDETVNLRRELQEISVTRWTVTDQERYSYQLERLNRERGLVVPAVRNAHND